jgi:hypothetical protein
MPFKDVATTDAIFMRTLPASSNAEGRRAIKRLQVCAVQQTFPWADLCVGVGSVSFQTQEGDQEVAGVCG